MCRLLSLLLLLSSFLHGEVCTFPAFSLEQAERTALQYNKDICTLCQLYQKARQGKLNSISKWLPEIDLQNSRGYHTQEKQLATGTYSAYITQFTLIQRLFSTDAFYDVKISTLVAENLKLLLEALTIDVLLEVRTLYYRIILDTQNIETAKTNIEILSNLTRRMESNYNRGTSILLNVNQSKVAVANATTQYYQAIKELDADVDRLANVMGYIPGQVKMDFVEKQIPIVPAISPKVAGVMKIFADKQAQGLIYKPEFPQTEASTMKHLYTEGEVCEWVKTALTLRPDLKSKIKEWKIANEEVNKEIGTYFPAVNFEFNYGGYPTYTQFDPSSTFFNQRITWAAGFNITWLIFDGFGREYRINQARYGRNAKLCEFRQSLQTTYEEVRFQIYSITESVASYVTAEGNVALAEQTLDLANKQLDIGYITVFDYQIVVDGLIQAIYIRDRARFDLIKGYYGLIHASGDDLKDCLLGS